MTRMTGPDCAVMCNLINTHTHIHRDKKPLDGCWTKILIDIQQYCSLLLSVNPPDGADDQKGLVYMCRCVQIFL